jgi:hypothetical protein
MLRTPDVKASLRTVMAQEADMQEERRIGVMMQWLLAEADRSFVEWPVKEMTCKSKDLCSADS